MWRGVLKDNQIYIIKFGIERVATVLKCLNLTRDGLIHIDVWCMARPYCFLFMSGYQLFLINIKAMKCGFWKKVSVDCFVFLLNVVDLRGSEIRLAFLYFLWFSSFAPIKNWGSSPNQSAAVCCSLIIPPLDTMIRTIWATIIKPFINKENLTFSKIHWKFCVPIQYNELYESVSMFHRAFFNSIIDKTPTHALFIQHYTSLACWFH